MNELLEKKRCDMCGRKLKYSFTYSRLRIARDTLPHKKDGTYYICEGCAGLLLNKLEHKE
jgi:hypothetical protein